MATSKITRHGVRIGDTVTDAAVSAFKNTSNPNLSQVIQLRTVSSLGDFMLFITQSGIGLYDNGAGQTIHFMNWDS